MSFDQFNINKKFISQDKKKKNDAKMQNLATFYDEILNANN